MWGLTEHYDTPELARHDIEARGYAKPKMKKLKDWHFSRYSERVDGYFVARLQKHRDGTCTAKYRLLDKKTFAPR